MRKELAEWKLNVDKDKGKGGKKGKGKVICDSPITRSLFADGLATVTLSAYSVFFLPCERKVARVARRRKRRKI